MSTITDIVLSRREQSSLVGRIGFFYNESDIRGFAMFVAATCDLEPEEMLTWARSERFESNLEDYVNEWKKLTEAKRISYLKKSGNHITWLRKPSQIKIREDITDEKFPCTQIAASLYVVNDYTPNSQIVSFKNFVRKVASQGMVFSLEHLTNLVEIWESLKVETKIELAKQDPEAHKSLEVL